MDHREQHARHRNSDCRRRLPEGSSHVSLASMCWPSRQPLQAPVQSGKQVLLSVASEPEPGSRERREDSAHRACRGHESAPSDKITVIQRSMNRKWTTHTTLDTIVIDVTERKHLASRTHVPQVSAPRTASLIQAFIKCSGNN